MRGDDTLAPPGPRGDSRRSAVAPRVCKAPARVRLMAMRSAPLARVAFGLLPFLAACLPIPHRHLDRPGVMFVVGDSAGRPVPGARLTVYTARRPSNTLDSTLTWTAPADSVQLLVPPVRSRHAVLFLPTDAEAPNAWIWCAAAPGHAAEVGELAAYGGQPIRVALGPGASTLTCAPSDSGYRAARGALALSGAR